MATLKCCSRHCAFALSLVRTLLAHCGGSRLAFYSLRRNGTYRREGQASPMIRHRLANIARRTPNVEYRPICFGPQMRPAVIDNTGSNGRQAGRGATSLRASGYDRAGVRQSFGRSASSIRRVSDAGAYPSTNANWRIPSIGSDGEGPVRGIGLVRD
jgi:hypothetical protein